MSDLISPEYEVLPNGAIKLESKDSMKKRGLHSPDIADALALTFAYELSEYEQEARVENTQALDRNAYDPFS